MGQHVALPEHISDQIRAVGFSRLGCRPHVVIGFRCCPKSHPRRFWQAVDLEATASNTFRGQHPANLQIDHHLYRGIPSIGNVEYTAHGQSVVVYLRGGGEVGAAYEIDADFAFNAPMFECPTTCAPFGPLMEAGALVFDHDDDA